LIPKNRNRITILVLWIGTKIDFFRVPEPIDMVNALSDIPSSGGQIGPSSINQRHNSIKTLQLIIEPRSTILRDGKEMDDTVPRDTR
jgi:hypothetical protein